MSRGGWEGWRTDNLTSASAPALAVPKGLPAQVAKVEIHAGDATSGGAFTFPFHAMPPKEKLAIYIIFSQLIMERHISTKNPRA